MKPYYETELGKLYCGNCLDILPKIESVDFVLTSPPYDKIRDYKGFEVDLESIGQEIGKNL